MPTRAYALVAARRSAGEDRQGDRRDAQLTMDFFPSETACLVRDTARSFAERTLGPRAAARDRLGTFPVEELKQLAQLGLLGVNIPESDGGAEAGVVAYSLAMQEIARADASVAVAMA